MNYELRKGRDGWEAKSRFPLEGPYALRLHTYKPVRGGVITTANRVEENGDGSYSFVVFQDYSKTLEWKRAARCTEKSVKEQHEAVLARLDEIKAEVAAFYSVKA